MTIEIFLNDFDYPLAMKKAIFLDRDGTIVQDSGYVNKLDDLKILPGVFEGLKKLQNENYLFFIVTNQSGIARKKFSLEDFFSFQSALINELKYQDIRINKTYFCPHIPEDNCNCRKPNPYSIFAAQSEFDLDLNASYVIGDSKADILLAQNAGINSICVLTGNIKDYSEAKKFNPSFIARDLKEAARWITQDY